MNAPVLKADGDAIRMPISDFHKALGAIERRFDAHWLNRVANDDGVYEEVRGYATGPLDFSVIAANRANIVLCGEQGVIAFLPLQPGLYEAHSLCLKDGRGRWMLDFTRACLHWLFTRTDAVECLTKCPKGNLPARALAKAIGGVKEFTAPRGWIRNLDPVPADVFGLTIQRWMATAPGLVERGEWFHSRLEEEFARHGRAEPPHEDDEDHNRAVGLACEMMMGGQVRKAILFYHRVAAMAGYHPIKLVTVRPVSVDIGSAIIVVRDDDFYAATLKHED